MTDYGDPSSKVGVLGGEKLKTQEKQYIYINDLAESCVAYSAIYLFADDGC